ADRVASEPGTPGTSAGAATGADTAGGVEVALSLVSHTNVGKTTLARTLLGSDVGIVRDEAHVTESADPHLLVDTPAGDRLTLWDTPGFGDSQRLARRLAQAGDALGWLLAQTWDRFRDRPFWSSQLAVRHVRDRSDVVLYLVNAAESPEAAGYVAPEMRILDWVGKPVVVLLNQLGPPRPPADEEREVQAWRRQLDSAAQVRAVLALDAFARCWVQEATLLRAIEPLLPPFKRDGYRRLVDAWLRRRRATFDDSIGVLAERVARAATDLEPLPAESLLDRMRNAVVAVAAKTTGTAGADTPKRIAMRRLAERVDADIRQGTDRLIALHGLQGHAAGEILARLSEHYAVHERLDESKAAALGGVVTGALAGLKADLATGGFTFGAGMLAGGVAGALGGFGLARGYNLIRAGHAPSVSWSDAALHELVVAALLNYLAVAHYGRGRGDWTASEHPPHWRAVVTDVVQRRRAELERAWAQRTSPGAAAAIEAALRERLRAVALEVLERLYPAAVASAGDVAADPGARAAGTAD
ncbi:MAG TPA: GTPase domain-containing protein, partial [Burkholderiaceae bacterium]|nr:GTPase domain-containing protein [Burkholderiaceae bacterium]